MKYIRKIFILLIVSIFMLGILASSKVVFSGYKEYRQAISEKNLEVILGEVKARENYVELKDISEDFLMAIVAIEDRRFLEHKGIDYKALIRALVKNIEAGEIVQGGSTITQQLSKNLYFDSEQNIDRKIAELFLAKDIERLYSKVEILEFYVNIIYYGNESYGIYDATNGYFGVNPSEITYDEAILLAGVPQGPSLYDLTKNMEGAMKKQKYVEKAINEMLD